MINAIKRAQSHLEQTLERDPSSSEISDYLNSLDQTRGKEITYNYKMVEDLISINQNVKSIDEPMTSESDSGIFSDIIPAGSEYDVDKEIISSDLNKDIKRMLSKFSDREKTIIIHYFGLFGIEKMNLSEIGERLDLTRERVRQIKERCIRRFRYRAANKILKGYLG